LIRMGHFSTEEQDRILHTIALAENQTSGEIRIVVEKRCKSDVMSRATHYFNKLGMDQTSLRNGVLIYVATEDHEFAIIGDQGINKLVPSDFWENTKNKMLLYFKSGNIVEGIIEGVSHAGKQLRTYFPVSDDDINELPDDIIFGYD